MKRLSELDLCHKAAITLFGVVCVAGALAGLLLASADGSGLSFLDPRAIQAKHCTTRLERALRGPMNEHLDGDEALQTVMEWVGSSAERDPYYRSVVSVFERCCFSCHGRGARQAGLASLYTYADVRPYAVGRGDTTRQVSRKAHVHLLGLAPVLFVVAVLVARTGLNGRWRLAITITMFVSLLADAAGRYLAKVHDAAGYLIWLSGLVLGLSVAAACLAVMHEVWRGNAFASGNVHR